MTQDVTRLVMGTLTWAGSRLQAARWLEFTLVQDDRDANIPVLDVDNGYTVYFYDDEENLLFEGNIYRIKKDRVRSSLWVKAKDHLHVLSVSKTTRKFADALPEDIASQVCKEMGVLEGDIVKTETPVSFIANRKTGYQIIMGAYTEAAKIINKDKAEDAEDRKRYQLVMNGAKLDVVEKGSLITDEETGEALTLDASRNMTESVYEESIEKLIDQVMVVDKEGNCLEYLKNDEHITKYSMFQAVYKEDPNKDTQTGAKALLTKPERGGYVTALGDWRVKASYSIVVKDTLFSGKFWIKSDTHTLTDGKHEMKLELEFENLMQEEQTEKEKTGKGAS